MSTTIKTQISMKSSGEGLQAESEWKSTLVTNTLGPAGGPVRALLATGVNTLTVPTGARSISIQPPEASTARFNLPGVSGGTGMILRTGDASLHPLPTGTSSVLVASDSQELVFLHWG